MRVEVGGFQIWRDLLYYAFEYSVFMFARPNLDIIASNESPLLELLGSLSGPWICGKGL